MVSIPYTKQPFANVILAAAIMKEDAAGRRYLMVKHFISRGVPSSIITLIVTITIGYGAMLIARLD